MTLIIKSSDLQSLYITGIKVKGQIGKIVCCRINACGSPSPICGRSWHLHKHFLPKRYIMGSECFLCQLSIRHFLNRTLLSVLNFEYSRNMTWVKWDDEVYPVGLALGLVCETSSTMRRRWKQTKRRWLASPPTRRSSLYVLSLPALLHLCRISLIRTK